MMGNLVAVLFAPATCLGVMLGFVCDSLTVLLFDVCPCPMFDSTDVTLYFVSHG